VEAVGLVIVSTVLSVVLMELWSPWVSATLSKVPAIVVRSDFVVLVDAKVVVVVTVFAAPARSVLNAAVLAVGCSGASPCAEVVNIVVKDAESLLAALVVAALVVVVAIENEVLAVGSSVDDVELVDKVVVAMEFATIAVVVVGGEVVVTVVAALEVAVAEAVSGALVIVVAVNISVTVVVVAAVVDDVADVLEGVAAVIVVAVVVAVVVVVAVADEVEVVVASAADVVKSEMVVVVVVVAVVAA